MKRGLIIRVVVVVVIAIALGIYFYPSGEEPEPTPSKCGGQGESIVPNPINQVDECCEGLKDVSDTRLSIADGCYVTGQFFDGIHSIICSNCGNGICENVEGVCGCAEDCIGKEKSDFNTIQEFCDSPDYDRICVRGPPHIVLNLDLCKLCA